MPIAIGLAAIVLAAAPGRAVSQSTVQSPNPAPSLAVRLDLTIAADGSVAEAVVGDNGSESVRKLVEQKVAGWRFAPISWQGQPATTSFTRFLNVQVLPTTTGGYALRMMGFGNRPIGKEFVPPSPTGSYRGFRSEVLYGFEVRVKADGRLIDIEPVLPVKHPAQASKAYARRIEDMLSNWRIPSVIVDGKPVECQRIYIEQHHANRIGTHLTNNVMGWADEIDLDALLPDQVAQVRQLREQLRDKPDACPLPMMVTEINGALL